IFLIGMVLAPASPRWLITRGRDDDARKVLSSLRGTEEIARMEFNDIKASLAQQEGGIGMVMRSARRPMVVLLILTFFQVFTGINAVVYYAPIIFAESGMGANAGAYANYGVGIALVASTAIALPIIDKLGRVKLLAISMIGQTIAMIGLWLLPDAGWISIFAIFVYTFAFGIGMGPVFWLLVPEVLPLSIRAIGTGIITFAQYLFNAIFSWAFPVALDAIGSIVFFIFALLSAAALWFVLARVPETSNKSLEEIEAYWRTERAAKQSQSSNQN